MSKNQGVYQGAIIGIAGVYSGKAYPLVPKEQVFFQGNDQYLEVKKGESDQSVCSIFYVPEYDEYCFEPFLPLTCFLISGQPLGKDRSYYLPRGTEFFIYSKNNHFKLA